MRSPAADGRNQEQVHTLPEDDVSESHQANVRYLHFIMSFLKRTVVLDKFGVWQASLVGAFIYSKLVEVAPSTVMAPFSPFVNSN